VTSTDSRDRAPTESNPVPTQQSCDRRNLGFWTTFSSTFVAILLAEMGDKTQLATLLISAQSHSPWIVFLGAGAALIATSLIGVLLGYWLSKRVSPKTMDLAAGAMLAIVSVLLLWDVVRS
jgi:Ca2+/H+ antiporter, TMEM165/GDT1 family